LTIIPIAILNSISSNNFHFNSYFDSNSLWPFCCNTSYTTSEYMLVRKCHCHASSAHISIQLQECKHLQGLAHSVTSSCCHQPTNGENSFYKRFWGWCSQKVFSKWCKQLIRRHSGCPEIKHIIKFRNITIQLPLNSVSTVDDSWSGAMALSLIAKYLNLFITGLAVSASICRYGGGCFRLTSAFPSDVRLSSTLQSFHLRHQQQLCQCWILQSGTCWKWVKCVTLWIQYTLLS